jgi:hypothetical protein
MPTAKGNGQVPGFAEALANLDVERTTPLEALSALQRLQAEAQVWLNTEQLRKETTHGGR